MSEKKFTREFLKDELGLPCSPGTYNATKEGEVSFVVHENEIVDHSRWSVHRRLVFSLTSGPDANKPGEAWEVAYSVGATESQDERPWEYENEVEATLVRLVEKTVKVWEVVPD
jgi:hypothetical protein